MKRATALIEFPPATGLEKEIIDKYQGTKKNLSPPRDMNPRSPDQIIYL